MTYTLPYFGPLDPNALDEYYRTEIAFQGSTITVDLNFAKKTIDQSRMAIIRHFLDSLEKFDKQNKSFIETNFNNGNGETTNYLAFYLEELYEEELAEIIDTSNKTISREAQLLQKLTLIRIGLYPDGKYGTEDFGVFDYSIEIDGEMCNQLLVVKTNHWGGLDHITWES